MNLKSNYTKVKPTKVGPHRDQVRAVKETCNVAAEVPHEKLSAAKMAALSMATWIGSYDEIN